MKIDFATAITEVKKPAGPPAGGKRTPNQTDKKTTTPPQVAPAEASPAESDAAKLASMKAAAAGTGNEPKPSTKVPFDLGAAKKKLVDLTRRQVKAGVTDSPTPELQNAYNAVAKVDLENPSSSSPEPAAKTEPAPSGAPAPPQPPPVQKASGEDVKTGGPTGKVSTPPKNKSQAKERLGVDAQANRKAGEKKRKQSGRIPVNTGLSDKEGKGEEVPFEVGGKKYFYHSNEYAQKGAQAKVHRQPLDIETLHQSNKERQHKAREKAFARTARAADAQAAAAKKAGEKKTAAFLSDYDKQQAKNAKGAAAAQAAVDSGKAKLDAAMKKVKDKGFENEFKAHTDKMKAQGKKEKDREREEKREAGYKEYARGEEKKGLKQANKLEKKVNTMKLHNRINALNLIPQTAKGALNVGKGALAAFELLRNRSSKSFKR